MPIPTQTTIESQVRQWIRKNKRENSRLEFKQRIDLSTAGAKAEFIRDVIALANSEGEYPRDEGHLVIGFRDGKCHDIQNERYEGAKFGQILDVYIVPSVAIDYEECANGKRGKVGVLVVKADPNVLYLVRNKLQDDKGAALLVPGQSWGRKSDRKIVLDGEAIQERISEITERKIADVTELLREKITKLEQEGGPALEVKRIRFEMEADREWSSLVRQLERLLPYAREFGHGVKHNVLDAVMEVTGRTRMGMPLVVAQSVDSVLWEVMPIGAGGLIARSHEEITPEDQRLLERIEHATFNLTWDACRYLRNIEMIKVGAHLYGALIKFAVLNGLERLKSEFVGRVHFCRYISGESQPFPEALKILDDTIADALVTD